MTELDQTIARYWGYTALRPLQREAMEAVLAGRDSVVVMPTGSGKSLCFQAPSLVRSGLAIVVSPLISLMKDQVDTLVGNGVSAGLYNSSLSADEKSSVLAGLRESFCLDSRVIGNVVIPCHVQGRNRLQQGDGAMYRGCEAQRIRQGRLRDIRTIERNQDPGEHHALLPIEAPAVTPQCAPFALTKGEREPRR